MHEFIAIWRVLAAILDAILDLKHTWSLANYLVNMASLGIIMKSFHLYIGQKLSWKLLEYMYSEFQGNPRSVRVNRSGAQGGTQYKSGYRDVPQTWVAKSGCQVHQWVPFFSKMQYMDGYVCLF